MIHRLVFTLLLVILPTLALAATPPATREMMLAQLDAVKCLFEAKYAPHEWKQSSYGWDLASELVRAKQKVLDHPDPTIKDFQRILRAFLRSTRDYHVNVQFFSTECATLPFSICGVDDRYFITYIDQDQLPADIYPIQVGDELLELDGQCIRKIIRDLKREELSGGESATETALVEHLFSLREGRWGVEVPCGPALVTIQSKDTRQICSYQIQWDYTPELVKGPKAVVKTGEKALLEKTGLMAHPWFDLNAQYAAPERVDPRTIGSRKSFLPALGRVVWESDNDSPFQAYIAVDAKGHRIGFIRIPDYEGDEEEAQAFSEVLARFATDTDLLVIDQLNNSGGVDMFCYALLAMLTDHPLTTPRHRISISQDDVLSAYLTLNYLRLNSSEEAQRRIGRTIHGYPVSYQLVDFYRGFEHFIINEWEQGRRLTQPVYLRGVDLINPHPAVRYRKPIVVLTNALCFSAADLFPAVLQDNRRAILFGETTAGAGGALKRFHFPNSFGIQWISYTATIAERAEVGPIEGVGVTPDVKQSFTIRDLQENYGDYMEALHRTIDIMLTFTPTAES